MLRESWIRAVSMLEKRTKVEVTMLMITHLSKRSHWNSPALHCISDRTKDIVDDTLMRVTEACTLAFNCSEQVT